MNTVTIKWNTVFDSTTSQYQVIRYKVRMREVGKPDWVTLSSGVGTPYPPVEGAIIEYTVRALGNCDYTYEFQLSGHGDGITYSHSFGNTTTFTSYTICPYAVGHQADHTINWIENRATYPEETPIPPPLKNMENPFTVLTTGVAPGANSWSGVGGLSVSKCAAIEGCEIVVERAPNSYQCIRGASACFIPDFSSETPGVRSGDMTNHVKGGTLYFELHADEYWAKHYEQYAYWTSDSSLMKKEVPRTMNTIYLYLKAIASHEFGHTAGLHDYPKVGPFFMGPFRNTDSVMRYPYTEDSFSPTSQDGKQTRAVYYGHTANHN